MTEPDQGALEPRNQRATKRRKTDGTGTKSPRARAKGASLNGDPIPSPKLSVTIQTPATSASTPAPEQKRALWLASLSRQELEEVAAGVQWHPGQPHNPECFVCKRAGGLVGCRRCPRSYHAVCAGIIADDPAAVDKWDCPACALLSLEGTKDIATAGRDAVESTRPKATHNSDWVNTILSQPSMVTSGTDSSIQQPGAKRQPQTPPKTSKSLDFKPSNPDQEKSKKRSRYSTLPSEVDEALAIINRELEAASYSKSIIAHTEARLHVAEQDLAIERGRAALTASKPNQDEVHLLQEQARQRDLMIEQLRKDNIELKAEADKNATKVKELEDWKRRMKMMIDGTAD